jgi:hypothetical protein
MFLKMSLEDQLPINHLSGLGLPPLWRSHINAWFTQAEAYFDLRKITLHSKKINHVILSLPSDVVQDVYDLLSNKYQVYADFKEALIKRFTKSEQERICQLLTAEELGDRTPSELLRRMQTLVNDSSIETGIFRQIFLQKLPTHVREILASLSDELTLVNLASIADKILVIRKQEPRVANVNALEATSHLSLLDQISNLNARLDHLANSRSFSLSRRFGREKRKVRTKSRCWYHKRFGKKARKCIPPCAFHKSGNSPAKP